MEEPSTQGTVRAKSAIQLWEMLAIENVFYACRWFMRDNLFTALLKRAHEGI